MYSYLHLLFFFTGIHIGFCASTMLSSMLWPCSKIKLGILIPPMLLFLLRIAFTIHCLFYLQMNFMVDFSISMMNAIGVLIGSVLNMLKQ
jgi:hypothetical protein